MGLGAKSRRNLLIQLQHWAIQNKRLCTGSSAWKKINKKAKRKNCMPGRKVQNQPAIFPSSLAAKHSCQQEPWCCSAQSSSTLISYKPQLGCLRTKQCPFWGLEGPFASFQMGTCTVSSALGKSRPNCLHWKAKKKFFFPFSLASTIFKWFHFTILPWVVPNKRFKSQTNCSEAEFAFAKGLSVRSLGWGVAMPQCHTFTEQLHSCLEADYSLGWLKINWIYFSHLGSHP